MGRISSSETQAPSACRRLNESASATCSGRRKRSRRRGYCAGWRRRRVLHDDAAEQHRQRRGGSTAADLVRTPKGSIAAGVVRGRADRDARAVTASKLLAPPYRQNQDKAETVAQAMVTGMSTLFLVLLIGALLATLVEVSLSE